MRSGAASALAFLVICACKAEDEVLTPDDESGRLDAGAKLDSGSSPIVGNDATMNTDASHGGNPSDATASGADAASHDAGSVLSGDAATDGREAGPPVQGAKDPDCDLSGLWIARQVTESVAVGLQQWASNWYYLEFSQEGEQVVVSRHMDCGMEIQGSALVQLAERTTRALMGRNLQTGRNGTFAKQSDGTCALSMEKFWSVRGVNEAIYAPNPRNRDVTIQQLQAENPLPADAGAAEDWDGDGQPGIAFETALGARHSGQRDWTRWFSAPGYQVTAASDFTTDLIVRAEFSNEETIYAADFPLLWATSAPNAAAAHTLTLRFLGRTRDDARAQAFLKADDFQTCLAIQAALPAASELQ